MIELPNKKKCYNLPEQVAQNLLNIQYLAEQYKNIDALPTIWQTYKEEFDNELETFGEWTTTFEGWAESLNTYLANMSSAAVGAIAGQNIAPASVNATGSITQGAANYTKTLNLSVNSSLGFDIVNVYNRFEVINQVLYCIVSCKVTNNTGATVSVPVGYPIAFIADSIDAAVASKIYDIEGNTVANPNPNNNTVICSVPAFASKQTTEASGLAYINCKLTLSNRTGANICRLTFGANEATSVDDGESLYLYGRMALTLL